MTIQSSPPDDVAWDERSKRYLEDPQAAWRLAALDSLEWDEPFKDVLRRENDGLWDARWFEGGRLSVTANCLDRWVARRPGALAISTQRGDAMTYGQLLGAVCQLANVLRRLGVREADHVVVLLPSCVPFVLAFFAINRLGGSVVVLQHKQGRSLENVLTESRASALITADIYKVDVDTALTSIKVKTPIVAFALSENPEEDGEVNWEVYRAEDEMCTERPHCPAVVVDSEAEMAVVSSWEAGDELLVLNSAGSLLQSIVNYEHMLYDSSANAAATFFPLGGVVGLCASLLGPLGSGGSLLLLDASAPLGAVLCLQKRKVACLVGSPSDIRCVSQAATGLPSGTLGSVSQVVLVGGGLDIATYRRMEVLTRGCAIIMAASSDLLGGFAFVALHHQGGEEGRRLGRPLWGFDVDLVEEMQQDASHRVLGGCERGLLAFRGPWPGAVRSFFAAHPKFCRAMMRQVEGRHVEWRFVLGLRAMRDKDGGEYWATGR